MSLEYWNILYMYLSLAGNLKQEIIKEKNIKYNYKFYWYNYKYIFVLLKYKYIINIFNNYNNDKNN